VRQQRFQIVGTRALQFRQRARSGESSLAVVAEKRIGVEDLSRKSRGGGCAHHGARRVPCDGACERQHAAGKCRAGLVEANCVQAIHIVLRVVCALTVAGEGITAGAAYTAVFEPFTTIVPTVAFPPAAPFTLHVMPPVSPPVPERLAVKACAPLGATAAVSGSTEIAMPSCSVTTADASSCGFATLTP